MRNNIKLIAFNALPVKYLLAAALLLPVSLNVMARQRVEVYLIAGQSNATGQGYTANIPAGWVIDRKVWLFHSGAPHLNSGYPPFTWQPLHAASESPDRFGLELGFGTELQKFRPSVKIAIIKHAHSGTNLYQQWYPGKNISDTLNQGAQYRAFIHTVLAGMDSLRKRGYRPVLRGMMWQQGEADADKGGTASAGYGRNLKYLISRIRSDLGAHRMIFVYGYVYPAPNRGAGISEVRNGQRDVDQDSGSGLSVKRAFVVNTDGLGFRADDPHTRYPKDFVHFGTTGIWELGTRMADVINKHL